jgi:hypothetical protein
MAPKRKVQDNGEGAGTKAMPSPVNIQLLGCRVPYEFFLTAVNAFLNWTYVAIRYGKHTKLPELIAHLDCYCRALGRLMLVVE